MSFAKRLRELREAKGMSRESAGGAPAWGEGPSETMSRDTASRRFGLRSCLPKALGVAVEEFKNGIKEEEDKPAPQPVRKAKPAKPPAAVPVGLHARTACRRVSAGKEAHSGQAGTSAGQAAGQGGGMTLARVAPLPANCVERTPAVRSAGRPSGLNARPANRPRFFRPVG